MHSVVLGMKYTDRQTDRHYLPYMHSLCGEKCIIKLMCRFEHEIIDKGDLQVVRGVWKQRAKKNILLLLFG